MPLPLLAAAPNGAGWLPAVAIVVGAAAVYLLLPRPRPYPTLWGVLVGILGLALAGVLLVPTSVLLPETFLFYAFSALAVIAGVLLVTQRNPARAALAFAMVVLSTCGLFLLLAAPFLMAATIIIYAGAVVVIFLFVLMLAQQEGFSSADALCREPILVTFTAALLLFTLIYVLDRGTGTERAEAVLARGREALAHREDSGRMEELLVGKDPEHTLLHDYRDLAAANGWDDLRESATNLSVKWTVPEDDPVKKDARVAEFNKLDEQTRARLAQLGLLRAPPDLPLSSLSGPPPSIPFSELRRPDDEKTDSLSHSTFDRKMPPVPSDNSAYLGRSLFTDYLLPVELGGTLLLVAAIGAIAIAHRRQAAPGREVPV
jgi:NADH:ubiquinone oxidoreductase subunit 6 (subunit J)